MQALVKSSLKKIVRVSTKREAFAKSLLLSSHKVRLARFFAAGRQDHSRGAEFNLKPKVCYYKVLNLSTTATEQDIKQAYQRLVKRLHPDVNPGSEEQFKEVIDAYSILSDPSKKEIYDTSIGIFDPDWGRADSQRFWTGDHKARMEEELAKLKGSIFYPTPEQEKYFKGELPPDKDRRLSDQERKTYEEKKRREEKPKEDHLEVNGKKHNTDELYSYFQAKYFKNPEVETVSQKEKLRFNRTLYNNVLERKMETEDNMLTFENEVGRFKVHKRSEDKIKSPELTALRLTAPLILCALMFIGMFTVTTSKPTKKTELSSKHVSHGEGYIAKISPT